MAKRKNFNSKKRFNKKSAIPEVNNVLDDATMKNENVNEQSSNQVQSNIPEIENTLKKEDKPIEKVSQKKEETDVPSVKNAIKENLEEEKAELKEYKKEVKELAGLLKAETGNLINKIKKKVVKEEPPINTNIPSVSSTIETQEEDYDKKKEDKKLDESVEVFENIQEIEKEEPKKESKNSDKILTKEEATEQTAILTRTEELKSEPEKKEKHAINPSSPMAIFSKIRKKEDLNNSEEAKPRINPSSPEALFKNQGIKTSSITGAASSYNPSSPEVLFRKQNIEMQQALQEELKRQKEKSNYNTNDLIMKFVYSNYDIVATKRFNIFAFLFGPLYFFYRKMYFYGLALFVAETFAIYTFMLSSNYMYILLLYLIVGLLSGALFNALYLKFVKSNVLEIEKNSESQKEAEKTCKLRGGVSTSAAFVPLIVAALFFGLVLGLFNKRDGSVEQRYAINIESNIEEYISNNEKYVIKMPTSDTNFACTRESENESWKLKDGYTITTGDCTTFMNSVANTTGSIYFNHLKSATIVITPNGMVTNGTIMEIDNFTCTLLSAGKFNCQKTVK